MTDDLARRLAAVEARLDIGQLPIRYAMAVDGSDVDAWVGLLRPGRRHGPARPRSRRAAALHHPQVRRFYRSMHQICGHRIELV